MVFLVYIPVCARFPAFQFEDGDVCELHDGLFACRWAGTRSQLYHGVKRQLPADTPLLVCRIEAIPKFKAMRPGALSWFRRVLADGATPTRQRSATS